MPEIICKSSSCDCPALMQGCALPRRLLCYRCNTVSLGRAGEWACAECLGIGGNRGRRAKIKNVSAAGTDVSISSLEPGSAAWVGTRRCAGSPSEAAALTRRDSAADSTLAGALRAVCAFAAADVHWLCDLDCAVVGQTAVVSSAVALFVGRQSSDRLLSFGRAVCGERRCVRAGVGAGTVEYVDCVGGDFPALGWVRLGSRE
jgi:hypothetical protein